MALGCGSLLLSSAPAALAQDTPAPATSQVLRTDAQIQSDVEKQLATAPGISGQKVTATTSNGVVTLSGTVTDEVTNQLVQNAVSGVAGVKSVQNNVTINGIAPAPPEDQTASAQDAAAQNAPAPAPANDQAAPAAQPQPGNTQPGNNGGWGPAGPPPDAVNGQVPPPQANDNSATVPQSGTSYGPPPASPYPAYPGYPPGQYPNGQAPMRPQYQPQPQSYQPAPQPAPQRYVQPKGPVTVPSGALVTVRLENAIDAKHLQVGDTFVANVSRDVFQDGVLALPRGATLEGKVIGVKKPGAFAGGGFIQLQLTQLDLDGHSYPLVSDVFSTETPGKGAQSAANTIGGAAFGALLGAAIGGGSGAAVGAVAGGAGGAAVSTATPAPRTFIPAEAQLTFHLTAPLTVQPVSYEEATRLAASVPNPRPVLQPRRAYMPPPPGYYPYPY
jgi:hypothetical protein